VIPVSETYLKAAASTTSSYLPIGSCGAE
jgi:hypothetical protein